MYADHRRLERKLGRLGATFTRMEGTVYERNNHDFKSIIEVARMVSSDRAKKEPNSLEDRPAYFQRVQVVEGIGVPRQIFALRGRL